MALYVGYEGARTCSGAATVGAKALMSWGLGAYGPLGATNLGIYNCRNVRGGSTTSLHGEGRACDFGFPVGDPDGNVLAEALRTHSAELGIQCVIYERKIWSGSYPNAGWRGYDGVNPHLDHIHVELSRNAAATLTVEKIQSVLGGALIPATAGPNPSAGARPETKREQILRVYGKGHVQAVQSKLIALGYDLGKAGADGDPGTKTQDALRAFQEAAKARREYAGDVDLLPGDGTVRALDAALSRKASELKVDGDLGPATIKRWQQIMGTPADGSIDQDKDGSDLVRAVQRHLNAAIGAGLKVDGKGIKQDGREYKTVGALQRYLGTPVDKKMSTPKSEVVEALQKRLNTGRF